MLDLVGTLVFALSGGLLGTRRGLDLFGVLVLAFVTAVVGGILRDLLIGAVPPASIAGWHPLAISVAGGLFAFRFSAWLDRLRAPVLFFDAAGLGVFAVTGTQKALDYGLDPIMAAVLGMLSGIGGGMVRDVLTAHVPCVLRSEFMQSQLWQGQHWSPLGHVSACRQRQSCCLGPRSACSCG